MITNVKTIWEIGITRQFADALVSIDDTQIMKDFLTDVMTEKELLEISSRLEAARMLKAGGKYSEIVIKTKLSSRTIARISDWMQNGSGGYDKVLKQIGSHRHIKPARAD